MVLCLYTLVFSVAFMSVSEAKYEFTVRFYEFRNPLGIQCGACESGGPPACCDDVQRNQSCNLTRPFTCDTRFRFLLRQFGASVQTAPTSGYRYFTPSNGGNSEVFNEDPGGFLGLPNPFTIAVPDGWTGRIQFHVDATDRAVSTSGISETLAIINRFSIDLEMTLRANFTERTTYTGIYNISGVKFDMSFRVQCSENYYGPNCTTLCEPMERVYTCDSEGKVVCLQDNHDPAANCSACLPGWDLEANCAVCLPFYDIQSNCTQCLPGRSISSNCTVCLPGYDPSINCTECLPNIPCQSIQATPPATTTSTDVSERNSNICDSCSNSVVTPAILGGALGLSLIINIVLLVVVVVVVTKKREAFAPPLSTRPTSVNEEEGGKGTVDIEMKPNSLYGMTSGSESIKTKPNEVYGISMTTEPSHQAAATTYEYVNP